MQPNAARVAAAAAALPPGVASLLTRAELKPADDVKRAQKRQRLKEAMGRGTQQATQQQQQRGGGGNDDDDEVIDL